MDQLNINDSALEEITLEEKWVAHNYAPLPVVISRAEDVWVTDGTGRRYLDCLAGYSALNFGHLHPKLVGAMQEQLQLVAMTSRAFYSNRLGQFAKELAELAGMEMVLPMNTGAEAVESAIKLARAWGYRVKGVTPHSANIVVMDQNFHGRTTTVISFSSDMQAREDFGPYTPGFRSVPFADMSQVVAATDENTVAVLVEPIQGEAGVIIPPDDFLPALRDFCDANNLLLIADEVQSGLGRTGRTFACENWGIKPDLYTLGKALGGGLYPVSAVVGSRELLQVLKPGEHGSTFGGNPLAAAIGLEVVRLLQTGEFQDNAAAMGQLLRNGLEKLTGTGITSFAQIGLWAGVTVDPAFGTGRQFCEALMARGVLAKDTHGSTIRLSPPLTISPEELEYLMDAIAGALHDLGGAA